jgi:hypothetical protein
MADKKVKPVEVETLRQNLRKYWLSVDDMEDEFGTDAAYQIEIVFAWLQSEEGEPKRISTNSLISSKNISKNS